VRRTASAVPAELTRLDRIAHRVNDLDQNACSSDAAVPFFAVWKHDHHADLGSPAATVSGVADRWVIAVNFHCEFSLAIVSAAATAASLLPPEGCPVSCMSSVCGTGVSVPAVAAPE